VKTRILAVDERLLPLAQQQFWPLLVALPAFALGKIHSRSMQEVLECLERETAGRNLPVGCTSRA
jgi:hypothetical protein